MSRYAIGDIHGGAKTLQALLDRLNLQQSDRLYLLGDYVDRGNDSKGVLDIIRELVAAGYDVHPLKGNHDDLFLKALNGEHNQDFYLWYDNWGAHTLASFGVKFPQQVPPDYLTLLAAMPTLLVEDDFVFAHAALDMTKADPLTETSELCLLWGEVGAVSSVKLGGRRLVTGHSIQPLALIKASMLTSHIYLDNGAFTGRQPGMGNLLALDLDRMKLFIQPWLDGTAEA